MHMASSGSVDCVVPVSTLEHVRYPQKLAAEIYRILKPGGLLYINVPFSFPFTPILMTFLASPATASKYYVSNSSNWIADSTADRHQRCTTY
jgi:ubiquinone/menaquinone biosynthesis C-methylase UbiE